jgi:sn-glycerol 3-phosphate transport system permease protein
VEVRIGPTYEVISDLRMLNSMAGLTVPLIASATATFLFRQFFLTVPDELVEAARIDGAGPMRFFWDILVPLSLPALATLAVIQFMWTWNDFLWPLVTILTNQNAFTLQLGLATFQGAHQTTWHLLAAANIMSMLPILALFLVAQRFFVRGIATQGLKG